MSLRETGIQSLIPRANNCSTFGYALFFEEEGRQLADVKSAARWERQLIRREGEYSGALRRIADHHPRLGQHLAATVRTGTFCSYTPDPRLPAQWTN